MKPLRKNFKKMRKKAKKQELGRIILEVFPLPSIYSQWLKQGPKILKKDKVLYPHKYQVLIWIVLQEDHIAIDMETYVYR